MLDYDVVVIGGGTSGTFAAIQAARTGARTLLVEKNGMLGGTTTVSGVALPGLFHAWGRQIIRGIGWDVVQRSVELARGVMPDFANYTQPHYRLQIPIQTAIYASLIDEEIVASGATLLLHTMVADLDLRGDTWNLRLCGKEGLIDCRAKRIIDCTGDANIVGQAGLARLSNTELQPGTIMVKFGGYDRDSLDYDLLNTHYLSAMEIGLLRQGDFSASNDPVRKLLRNYGENSIHVTGIAGGTSAQRTAAELAARATLMRVFRFLRDQPGLENLAIDHCATECGIRETYTIVGQERVTVDDYVSGRLWPDSICYSFYPVDVHQPDGDGIDIRPLRDGIVPTIPRGALLPKGSDFIAVAGRCIAGDQEANSAYRVQATCMATGQAAGAMTALSAIEGVAIGSVPMSEIHSELTRNNAIVPPLRS